jgi:hypothetical protein
LALTSLFYNTKNLNERARGYPEEKFMPRSSEDELETTMEGGRMSGEGSGAK